MAHHMAYFFSVSSFCFWVTTNKNNHKSLYIACPHPAQHNYQTSCLLRSLISIIHPDKIKPYSQLHVSMTSLANLSTLMPTHHPDLFFLCLIGCQATTTEFYSPPIGHPSTWLIIISPLLIIIPGIHSLTCLMTTRSLIIYIKPCSILLKFILSHTVSLYLFFNYIFMIISNSLYAKIY